MYTLKFMKYSVTQQICFSMYAKKTLNNFFADAMVCNLLRLRNVLCFNYNVCKIHYL